jgi:DNA polymerase I
MSVLDHVDLHRVDSIDEAMEMKRWLGERREVLGVDTETGGFSPERDRLRMVQFGDLNHGWAIPFQMWGGVAREVMRTYEGPLVLHNSKFDARFITKNMNVKWPWHRTNDTMCMAHLDNPLRSKGLKPLSAMLVDPKAAAAQRLLGDAMRKNDWTWDTIPDDFPYYWAYGAMDPVLTCHIYDKLKGEVYGSYREVYDLEMAVTRVVAGIEVKGARVNLDYADLKMRELRQWANQARDWLREEFGIKNPTPQALIKFFTKEEIEFLDKQTDGGNQSMDKEVLQSVQHPVAKYVLAIRRAEKMAGTYFENFLKFADADGYVHSNIWTMGTRTARMSVSDPALQTLHRRDPIVREAFVPSPRRVLITSDYDQIEARLAAHFSRDEGLRAAFLSDEDFFCAIAGGIFGRTIIKGVDDSERDLTKNVVYGKLYGAGVTKMAVTARVGEDVMGPVVAGFDSKYPGIRRLQREIHELAQRRSLEDGEAWIRTPMGRRLVSDDGKDYTLTNYLIQCHAGEILKRSMVELDAVLDLERIDMILPVHDELIFDCDEDYAEEACSIIEKTMRRDDYLVPITATPEVLTESWGQKYRKAA